MALVWTELRHGIALGPDGWTYWSASVSLLRGEGYLDAHGLPVLAWPPLYSLWLAAVQAVTGVSIAGVRLADGLAMGLAASAFTHWALSRTRGSGGVARWPVAAFVTAALVVQTRGAASQYLMLASLGGLLLVLDSAGRSESRRVFWSLMMLAAALASAMALTRHAALALVVAAVPVVASMRERSVRQRIGASALVIGTAVVAWWTTRLALGQTGSHGLSTGDRDLLPTGYYMLRHVGRGLAPFPVGIFLFLASVWILGSRRRHAPLVPPALSRQGDAVAFVLSGLLVTLLMFLLVHVSDPPGERFVGFASLLVGALAAGVVRHLPSSRWKWLALALLLVPAAARAGKHVVQGRTGVDNVTALGGESFLPPSATLDPMREPGAVLEDGRIVVAAPLFAWQQERLRRGEGRR